MEMSSFVVCPRCHADLIQGARSLDCRKCERTYPLVDDVPQFDQQESVASDADEAAKVDRRNYWDEGWKARVQNDHAFLTQLKSRSEWEPLLERAVQEYKADRRLLAIEAGREAVQGKVVLDIGCGSGRSGPVFGYYGARYIGLDHSRHAAMYTRGYLKCAGMDGFTVQGNAEAMPIRDNSIDVVYSNGVLHHTPKFLTAMDEVYRVLKPGGKAVIALYTTFSTQFGALRVIGALKGNLSRQAMQRWVCEQSEGDWRTGNKLNPWTETFTKARLRDVVSKYAVSGLVLRKSGHPIGEIPRLGPRLMRLGLLRGVDRLLEPILGDMVVMSFNKQVKSS